MWITCVPAAGEYGVPGIAGACRRREASWLRKVKKTAPPLRFAEKQAKGSKSVFVFCSKFLFVRLLKSLLVASK
jgi:hypothetical protein